MQKEASQIVIQGFCKIFDKLFANNTHKMQKTRNNCYFKALVLFIFD